MSSKDNLGFHILILCLVMLALLGLALTVYGSLTWQGEMPKDARPLLHCIREALSRV